MGVVVELVENDPWSISYTFKAHIRRVGVRGRTEIMRQVGDTLLCRRTQKPNLFFRGTSRLGTSRNWLVILVELNMVNGVFRLHCKTTKVRRANGNDERISSSSGTTWF